MSVGINLISGMLCAWIYWKDFSMLFPKKEKVVMWKILSYIVLFAVAFAWSFDEDILNFNIGILLYLFMNNLPYLILVYVFIRFFEGNLYTKIGMILGIDVLLSLFTMAVAVVEKLLYQILGLWDSSVSLLIGLIGIYLLNFLFCSFLLSRKQKYLCMKRVNFSIWSVFLFGGYLMFSNIVSSLLFFRHIQINIVVTSILIASVVCLFIILYQYGANKRLEQDNYYLNLQKNLMQEHYKALKSQMTQMRKFRHDIAGYLQVIDSYLQEDQYLKAVETENGNEIPKYCENILLNFAIHNKVEECREKGIAVEFKGNSFDIGKIEEIEILGALYNLFNNAIEANLFLEKKNRYLYIRIQNVGGYLEFIFENPKSPYQVVLKGKRTSKKDEEKHGYGMEILRDIAEKYQGSLEVQHEESRYRSTLRVRC